MSASEYTTAGLERRGRGVILAVVIALAVIGYVVGLRAGVPDGPPGLADVPRGLPGPTAVGDVIPSLTYDEVGAGALRARRTGATWDELVAGLRAKPGEPVTDEDVRKEALRTRAERRAYNGAPPVIPHMAHGMDDRSCLSCHGHGVAMGGQVARPLPHAHLTNCTQCHVPAAPAFLQRGSDGLLADNSWQGVPAPFEGPRASEGAPPAVPHTLQMRENCLACHGPQGWKGMQTTHPERRACLQCHAPIQDRAHPGRLTFGTQLLPPIKVESK